MSYHSAMTREEIAAVRARAAEKTALAGRSGQERCELRKGLRTAMAVLRELRAANKAQAATLLLMHNNFRAMKGLPPHEPRERRADPRWGKLLEIERLWLR